MRVGTEADLGYGLIYGFSYPLPLTMVAEGGVLAEELRARVAITLPGTLTPPSGVMRSLLTRAADRIEELEYNLDMYKRAHRDVIASSTARRIQIEAAKAALA